MAGYQPLKITGMTTGLVQERENFLLPDDAYPVLQNAYVWREKLIRKKGFTLLGRLQRLVGVTDGAGNAVIIVSPIPLNRGLSSFIAGSSVFVDPGTNIEPPPFQVLNNSGPALGLLNRATASLSILGADPNTNVYYLPGLPVMGICKRELQNSSNDETIFFDQVFAYRYNAGTGTFEEFIPGTTWNAANLGINSIDFFWSTNYWVSGGTINPFGTTNIKLFWVTNNSGHSGALADPPRITDGTTWVDFFPAVIIAEVNDWSRIDDDNYLTNYLCNLPYRGRMVVFNTWEGPTAASALNYSNRIRWSTIGNPFIPYKAGPPATGSWRDDIRGQGGFLDIPTSEDIVAIGFVRDNLVIYCERSTWQLRYTGRSIAPFQIERVNSELGTESTFGAVQFDTSLIGVGDKGVVQCDSYKADRIDVKIPDFVFQFNNQNNGVSRVQGIRDFPNRLAYWTCPLAGFYDGMIEISQWIFPNIRLVYNYENDSWATFNDSLTALGTFQEVASRTWLTTPIPWLECNFTWIEQPSGEPLIVGGNQQGFIEILDNQTVNDVSLFITDMTANTTTATLVRSPNHNMNTGFIIEINGIIGAPFATLNGGIFSIVVIDHNTFELYEYDPETDAFITPNLLVPFLAYKSGGLINIRENFSIKSKKFNFLDQGQSIQMGYIDILMVSQNNGAIALNVYLDYNDSSASNILPDNAIDNGNVVTPAPDTFFNQIVPTSESTLNAIGGTKFWHRAYCPTRSDFITLEYTFNNLQMISQEQELSVQIDAQILWLRKAGRMNPL